MKSVAIVGTGIAGMACGYFLHPKFRITLFERNDYPGGHTNTVVVQEGTTDVPVDTGFMVYNEVTYPELTRLFSELQVETKPTSMSFSVQHRPSGLEFSGSGWNGLFAQRKNLFRPRFWKLLKEIDRFNTEAPALLDNPAEHELTLKTFARQKGFSREFLDAYLIPMSSAVWSTPPDSMLEFPAITLIRFFKNHGFLGLNTQHPWRTVAGGSRMYREKLLAPFRDRVRLSSAAARVQRNGAQVDVTDAQGHKESFDHVILACHADEALALLSDATPQEHRLLSPFRYQRNIATLHTDESVMPRTRRAWSSWNYRSEEQGASTIYWMNSLQNVSQAKNYFVSINDSGTVDPAKILKVIEYTHPVFSVNAIRAQASLPGLNEKGPVYFCGSYFRYGFHEDALVSAIDVCKRLAA